MGTVSSYKCKKKQLDKRYHTVAVDRCFFQNCKVHSKENLFHIITLYIANGFQLHTGTGMYSSVVDRKKLSVNDPDSVPVLFLIRVRLQN